MMNQESNNLNTNNFNTQGNNGIPNNQPLNNQSFNQGMSFNQQPVNPQPQPMNTFESGNASNQNFNSKPPKKINLGLIIGIVAVVAVVGVGIVFGSKLFSNENRVDSSNSTNNSTNNSQISTTIKNQEYFNKLQTSKNKLSVIFSKQYIAGSLYGPNVFIGIDIDGISGDFYFRDGDLKNDFANYLHLTSNNVDIQNDDYEITIGDAQALQYDGKNIGNDIITKLQGNYLVYKDSDYDLYFLGLKYNETTYDGKTYWNILRLGKIDNPNDITQEIAFIEEHYSICTYEEDINNCKSLSQAPVNYKDYRYYGDMIVDYLNKNQLYIDSYKQASISYSDIVISNGSSSSDYTASFAITENDVFNNYDIDDKFTMNNKEFYISDQFIGMPKEKSILNFQVILRYGIEYTKENCIKEFKKTFENK